MRVENFFLCFCTCMYISVKVCISIIRCLSFFILSVSSFLVWTYLSLCIFCTVCVCVCSVSFSSSSLPAVPFLSQWADSSASRQSSVMESWYLPFPPWLCELSFAAETTLAHSHHNQPICYLLSAPLLSISGQIIHQKAHIEILCVCVCVYLLACTKR